MSHQYHYTYDGIRLRNDSSGASVDDAGGGSTSASCGSAYPSADLFTGVLYEGIRFALDVFPNV